MKKTIHMIRKRAVRCMFKTALVLNDSLYAKIFHRVLTGEKLNIKKPDTFNDKLWWLKLYNRNPLLVKCSDKVAVREYVDNCGLSFLLNDLYNTYKSPKDIDFSQYKTEVFIKCNHSSGANVIYNPEKEFDYEYFVKLFSFHMKQNYYLNSREWNYKDINRRIIVEKVLRDSEGKLPNDYKFMCFNGEPKLMLFDTNICMDDGKKAASGRRNVYDMDFNLLDLKINRDSARDVVQEKPENFEDMKRYAAILSAPFPHARVDFYNFDGKVFFGEITFYNHGGSNRIIPAEWNKTMGDWIDLSTVKTEKR